MEAADLEDARSPLLPAQVASRPSYSTLSNQEGAKRVNGASPPQFKFRTRELLASMERRYTCGKQKIFKA